MDIKYRILSVDDKEHSFVVRYYTDIVTEDYLTAFFEDDGSVRRGDDGTPLRCRSDYNMNMFNVHATHEELDKFIRQGAPWVWFEMLEHTIHHGNTIALTNIKEKMNQEHVFTHVPPPKYKPPIQKISDDEVAALIAKLT